VTRRTSSDIYIIKQKFQSYGSEYFLIENRQPKWFDSLLWSGGILIWHIDDTARQMHYRGYPGQEGMLICDSCVGVESWCRSQERTGSGWPGNNKHYQIALLAPDGKYGLETGGAKVIEAIFGMTVWRLVLDRLIQLRG
jgi:hypothetical protein